MASSSSFNPIHLNHPVAIKLTRNNLLSWQSQITPILYSHGLLKFLESSPPIKYLHPTYLSQINPAYSSWCIQDQLILHWLRSSLSDTILGQVASCTTSRELWTSLPSLTQNPLPQPTPTLPPQPPKSLSKLLKEHDLPPGLFPRNITCYKFDVYTREITVNMPGNFDVFGLRFSNTVTGSLERGRLNNIKGIRMESLTWDKVHCIKTKFIKGKLHLHFTGNVDKVRPFDQFTYHVKFDDKKQRF